MCNCTCLEFGILVLGDLFCGVHLCGRACLCITGCLSVVGQVCILCGSPIILWNMYWFSRVM